MNEKFVDKGSIACTVSLGMFSSERGVTIMLPDGRSVDALVDESDVSVQSDPTTTDLVDGELKVSIIDSTEDSLLIELPQPSFAYGTRFEVPRNLVKRGNLSCDT